MSPGIEKERISLCEGSRRLLTTPNAGGRSEWSEAMSCEALHFLSMAVLHKTEMEIEYIEGSKITDYSIKLFGRDIGVSVTRCMKFVKKGEEPVLLTEEDATKLLEKKLRGVNESTKGVISQKWDKQILHVWTEREYMCGILWNAFEKLDAELKNDTLVIVTVCENAPWIF